MITYVITIIGNIIDGIVTGSFLGTSALAAYGLATPFLTVLTAIASAMSVGTSTLLSSKFGKGDLNEMKKAFRVCFWTILFFSAGIGAVIFLCADPISTALGTQGEVHEMTAGYIRGYAIGIPSIFMIMLAMPVMQLIGKQKMLVISTVVLSAVNVLGDFINVLLVHGGMFGMALATTISFYVAFAIVLLVIQSKDSMLTVAPEKPDAAMIRDMVVYGAPVAVSMGCRNIMVMLLNILVRNIAGMGMVAAYAAITSAMNIAMSLGAGMASSVSILTGVFSGEKDKQDLMKLVKISGIYAVIINAVCIIIFMVLSGNIVSLFLKDGSLLADAAKGMRIVVLYTIPFSVNFCLRSYYQAMKMRISIPYAIFNGLIGTTLFAFVLGHTIGITGVWAAYPLGEMLTLIVFVAYALLKKKSANCGILERIMMIPESYDDEIEPVAITASSMEDVIADSIEVSSYMKEHGAADRVANYTSMAVEELAGNIIRHGFGDGKLHHVYVKLKKSQGQWLLRLRDDCRSFDPVDYVKHITPEEKQSHYGIRMIYGLADEVRYLNTLKMNNLLIRFSETQEHGDGNCQSMTTANTGN